MVRPERLFALRAHPYGVALQAINLAAGQVVELGLFVCREFDHDVEPAATTKGSQARKAMVRPERFELPASWFVARRSIQLSYGRRREDEFICGSERDSDPGAKSVTY